ncbi:MAG: type I secretion system permease/ATPase [bacterium]|nr:type I secretion system permease/ATPase [bacterium]
MSETTDGSREIRGAISECRKLFMACGIFSVFVNVLMLTGPVFMLQVYDRVLSSRSEATLLTLVMIVAFLFLMMGVLDYARGRVLARAGARLQSRLDSRVLRAVLDRSASPAERSAPSTGPQDLEAIQRFCSSQAPFAFFDAPFTPLFLAVLFAFHWLLGVLAVFSGVLLAGLALLSQKRTGQLQLELQKTTNASSFFIEQMRAGGETVAGLGMRDAVVARSKTLRNGVLDQTLQSSDRLALFSSTSKTLRLFLQSMMLGLGAWLAIEGEITPGLMIAASILLGRALAPIDSAIGQWPVMQQAVRSYRSLSSLLAATPEAMRRTSLPKPRAVLDARRVVVAPPGARYAIVRNASLRLEPGQAAGIAGPTASGKSTFARALAGVWTPAGGSIRLDGAELEQYGDRLGEHVGYLPQEVVLFDGTVAENIARLSDGASDEEVVEAAKRAGAHEMILGLPDGYDFRVSSGGAALSGGQRQRIALARALFRNPAIIVMDEPDSNLDAEGTMALARALEAHKQRGGAAVVVAHRHGAFAQCDTVYIMEDGRPVPAVRDSAGRKPVRTLKQADAQGGPSTSAGPRPQSPSSPDSIRQRRIEAVVQRLRHKTSQPAPTVASPEMQQPAQPEPAQPEGPTQS